MPTGREHATVSRLVEDRWNTRTYDRTVLAVVRTKTSAIRLLDALPLFGADERIRIRFVFDDSSAFSHDVPDFLRATGIHFVPLSDIARLRADLALMASENIELADIDAPVIVLPHGTGFHRQVPDSAGPGYRLAGVPPADRLVGKQVWLAIPHPAQRDQLTGADPQAAARCVVVGDLVFDQLTASLPSRDRYRRALGVHPGRRLVVLTSTWGDGSLFKSWPRLPERLLGELPADEYAVALVLHPNVWADQGEYLLKLRLADARRAGLLLLPPASGWQAALVAADAVLGDHGSVTMYAAALDRPVLLTGDRTAARVLPGTPPDELAGMTSRLDPGTPLAPQVDTLIEEYKPGQLGALADRMFAKRGKAAQELRALVYKTLGLPMPDTAPPSATASVPELEPPGPRSFMVHARIEPGGAVRLWRLPAAVRNAWVAPAGAVPHLCADEDDPDPRRLGNASVIVRRASADGGAADAWSARTFAYYPDCLATATAIPGACLVALREGIRVRVDGLSNAAIAGSAVYARSRPGPLSGPLTIYLGAEPLTVTMG